MQWEKLSVKKNLEKLQTSFSGLSIDEAQKRFEIFGLNKIPEPKKLPWLSLLIKQFNNYLVYILLAVIIISLAIQHYIDAGFVFFVVIINSLVSFIQENKAENSLRALKRAVKTKARVLRQGKEQEILAENLVPGDIIILRAGDKVPADARLIKANNLKISEASLTGEFWAVKKGVALENLVYLGTEVEQGTGRAVVFATGKNTKIGSLALVVKQVKEQKTPLQKKILEFSRILALLIIIIGCLVFIISQDFYTATALVVSAIPEGLLPVITVVLVVGMRRILKKKGLVRKLSSAESLGSTTVLCVDKTGTLTTGKMALVDLVTENQKIAWQIIAKCNEAIVSDNQVIGRPTDKALLLAGMQAGYSQELENRKDFMSFDNQKKYLAAFYPGYLYIAGAPEILLNMSDLENHQDWIFRINKLSRQGLRLIGLACKKNAKSIKDLKNLNFIGLAVIKDPLRPDAKKSLEICKRAGIRVIMATGDHKLTAKAVAQEIGLDTSIDKIINGTEFTTQNIRDINIFSRVTPEQKLQIVQAWQKQGEVVAMTGDGVNDAPALKRADIGIALADGTDVAKGAADLILLKNSFSTIVTSIEQGRNIFENIKKVILYLLSNDLSEIILILLSIVSGLPLPLLPAQILWINLIEDTFPDFALSLEKSEGSVMNSRMKNRKIFDDALKRMLIIIGAFTGLTVFALFIILINLNFDLVKIRTILFATTTVNSLVFIFSCRSLHHTIFNKNIFENKYLVLACLVGFWLLLASIYLPILQYVLKTVPLSSFDWSIIFTTGIIDIILIELFKWKFVIKKK